MNHVITLTIMTPNPKVSGSAHDNAVNRIADALESLPGCVKVYHGRQYFGCKGSISQSRSWFYQCAILTAEFHRRRTKSLLGDLNVVAGICDLQRGPLEHVEVTWDSITLIGKGYSTVAQLKRTVKQRGSTVACPVKQNRRPSASCGAEG